MENMDILQESPILLSRLYKAARTYYLMKEGDTEGIVTQLHIDLIREELTAALVAVKLLAEPNEEVFRPIMSGEVDISALRHHATRRREWQMAKILADNGFSAGSLLKPSEYE